MDVSAVKGAGVAGLAPSLDGNAAGANGKSDWIGASTCGSSSPVLRKKSRRRRFEPVLVMETGEN